MKVLITFIPPDFSSYELRGMNMQPPTAIYLLGTILRAEGIETDIVDPANLQIKKTLDNQAAVSRLLADVDIVALSTNSYNWGSTKRFIDLVKQIEPEITVIIGGIHPTKLDPYPLQKSNADVVVRGEGEKTLPELVRQLRKTGLSSLSGVKGITYKLKNGEIVKTPDRPVLTVEEYNSIIYPDFNEVPADYYSAIPCETSRGCLYSCTFCGINYHKSWRALTTEESVRKIDYGLKVAKAKISRPTIVLCDDCFTVDKDRMNGVFSHLRNIDTDFRFMVEGRLSDLKCPTVLEKLPIEKLYRFLIGIESGYDDGLKRIKKGYTKDQIDKLFKRYKNNDILEHLLCTFIIGLPWETKKECIKTIQFAAYLYEEYGVKSNINWWNIIPSELWDNRRYYNIKVDEDIYDDLLWYRADVTTEPGRKTFFSIHPQLNMEDIEGLNELVRFYLNRGIKLIDS